MIFVSSRDVRLTLNEQDALRQAAKRNGVVLKRIRTPAELLDATLAGLSLERKQDMLEFLDTGSSPQTRALAQK